MVWAPLSRVRIAVHCLLLNTKDNPELSLMTGHTSHSRHRHVEHSLWQLTLLYGNLVAGKEHWTK